MGGSILVTGGAGYLGSALTASLLAAGSSVVVLDDLTFGDVGIRALRRDPGLRLIEADVRDAEAVRAALHGVDAVVHLAAIANDPSGDLDTALTRSINHDAYPPLLEEAARAGVGRFINASSFSVYGVNVTPNITEQDPLNCRREYSTCKAQSEALVRAWDSPSMTTVNIRLATLCGWSPRMRFDLIANRVVGEAQVLRRVVVVGGEQQRPHIHLADVCDLVGLLLTAPPALIGGEVFNAGGENVSILGMAQQAKAVVERGGGGEVALELRPPRDDERSYHVSSEKLARVLGFTAGRSVRQAMADIADAHAAGLWSDFEDVSHHNLRRLRERLSGAPA